ncbi:MAG: hypothetical protein WCK27_19890, partial [Verrucomicrobiota bacterium]
MKSFATTRETGKKAGPHPNAAIAQAARESLSSVLMIESIGQPRNRVKYGGSEDGEAQGCSKVGPGHSKPETRRPKAERNPKAEVRIDSH